jgi:hypothetical protein
VFAELLRRDALDHYNSLRLARVTSQLAKGVELATLDRTCASASFDSRGQLVVPSRQLQFRFSRVGFGAHQQQAVLIVTIVSPNAEETLAYLVEKVGGKWSRIRYTTRWGMDDRCHM